MCITKPGGTGRVGRMGIHMVLDVLSHFLVFRTTSSPYAWPTMDKPAILYDYWGFWSTPAPCGSAGVCYRSGSVSPSYCPPLWPFHAVTCPPLPRGNISPVTLKALKVPPKKTILSRLLPTPSRVRKSQPKVSKKLLKRHPKADWITSSSRNMWKSET